MGDKGTGTLSQSKTITLIPAKELGLFPFEIFPDRKKGIRNLSPCPAGKNYRPELALIWRIMAGVMFL
jgi:hypothetical protein